MRIVIVANGIIARKNDVAHLARKADFIIAADGGAAYCVEIGIFPDVVIGDLDSISTSLLNMLKEKGKIIISYPADKDFTDLELALKYAVDRGANEIIVAGALGARWDMSVANLLLLGSDFLAHIKVKLVVENQTAIILRGGDQITIEGTCGDLLSLIPLSRDVHGVSTTGLRYPLKNEALKFAAARGVSNQFSSSQAVIRLDRGLLLCIYQLCNARCGVNLCRLISHLGKSLQGSGYLLLHRFHISTKLPQNVTNQPPLLL